MKDFSLYPLLLPQLASDALQNVPFCSGERDLQGHALLAAATPSPPQPYFQPSPSTPEPLPGLVGMRSQRFEKSGEKIPKTRRFNFQNENFRPAQKWISIISIVKRGSLLPLLEGKKILFVFFVFFPKKSRVLMLLSCLLHATGTSRNTCKEVCCANICPRCCFFSFLSAEISRMLQLRASEAVFHF
jgi:hypothetical protein